MARTPKPIESTSVRYTTDMGAWLRKRAEARGASLNDEFVELIDDAMTWFGLPGSMVEILEQDRKAHKKADLREYLIELLVQRYNQLVRGPPEREKR